MPRAPAAARGVTRLIKAFAAGASVGLALSACSSSYSNNLTPAGHATPDSSGSAHSPSGTSGSTGLPLAGRVIGIDPGHNGGNFAHQAYISRQVWNGRAMENCDTTGTATDAGYTEAQFTFRVASYLAADLRRDGATVVMTRYTNSGVGPCIDRRAQILNQAHAAVAIDVHGDGYLPASGRGFTVLEPIADGPNDQVIASSRRFGLDVRTAFLKGTSIPVSNYDGVNGIIARNDLAGLNLTTVPKVLIECGNMRNAMDARLMTTVAGQQLIARALEHAIVAFLAGR